MLAQVKKKTDVRTRETRARTGGNDNTGESRRRPDRGNRATRMTDGRSVGHVKTVDGGADERVFESRRQRTFTRRSRQTRMREPVGQGSPRRRRRQYGFYSGGGGGRESSIQDINIIHGVGLHTMSTRTLT